MEELRHATRVPFPGPIEQMVLHCSDYPRLGCDDEFIEATAINISSGGLRCETARKLEPLAQVFCMFTLPGDRGDRHIKCETYIAYASFDGQRCVFGLRFSDLAADDQAAVDAYIESRR